jgi:hypothetical protein
MPSCRRCWSGDASRFATDCKAAGDLAVGISAHDGGDALELTGRQPILTWVLSTDRSKRVLSIVCHAGADDMFLSHHPMDGIERIDIAAIVAPTVARGRVHREHQQHDVLLQCGRGLVRHLTTCWCRVTLDREILLNLLVRRRLR